MTRLILIFILIARAQIGISQTNEKVIITGSRFTYPLIRKWIEEFTKTNPNVQFSIIPRGTPNVDSANVIINAHELSPEEIRPSYKVINIARYALLPVANEKNPALATYEKKGLSEKELKALFFKKYDPLQVEDKKPKKSGKEEFSLTLYTREQKACAPTTFARNFGFDQSEIVGIPIGGDDHHLISAVQKDPNGITYNNLGFIYDLKTRQVNKGLKVIPIDANGNDKLSEDENFYSTLDQVIAKVEKNSVPGITVGLVNISFPTPIGEQKNIARFLDWVLNEGQKYNHEFGFLNMEDSFISKQREKLK